MLEKWKLLKKITLNDLFSKADIRVALRLLDHYNDKIQKIYPSNRRLVTLTGLSLRQVQLSTAKLDSHNLITKFSKNGKNHYKITPEGYQNYEQPYTSTTNKPSPPTKPISLTINIKDTISKIAKRSNPNYRAVISNGLTYHENMENKLVKQMRSRLSIDRYNSWLLVYDNKETKQKAISYAKELCG